MPPRTKMGELPKPTIRPGSFGCLPLNPFTLSYLEGAQADLLLGYRDTAETEHLKQTSQLILLKDSKKIMFSLENKFFNGYSEALYRGLLPEVMLIAPDEAHLEDFLQDFLDYLHKITTMGFLLPKNHGFSHANPIAEFIPCTILIGNGLLFSQFISGLVHALSKMNREQPLLDEETRLQIMRRFVRGFPQRDNSYQGSPYPGCWLEPESLAVPVGRTVQIPTVQQTIHIAGGNVQTRQTIQAVLAKRGIHVVSGATHRNAVERLEFENILWRLSAVILPKLSLSPEENKDLTPRVMDGILSMGRCRQAFDESDRPENWTKSWLDKNGPDKNWMDKGKKKSARTAPNTEVKLTDHDADLLRKLGLYAESLGLSEECRLYESLAERVVLSDS